MHHPTDRIAYTIAFVKPVLQHSLEKYRKEIFIYDYKVKDHSYNKKNTICHLFIGYSFQLLAYDIVHAPSYIQDSTYHGRC